MFGKITFPFQEDDLGAHSNPPHARQNVGVPRVVRPSSPLPAIVIDVVAAFGSQLRLELIRHYGTTPSTQADAARALGVQNRSVSNNTAELVRLGILLERPIDEDSARTLYSVDQKRLKRLLRALDRYANGLSVNTDS